ncbi:MAG: diphosphate--fructose-6-phosphate 1-phosphotransferase [Candidatus Anammoxibacter sp.]
MTQPLEKRNSKKTLGILVAGGPAPGINGIISAATIEAVKAGMKVIGIRDGFKWLSLGDKTKIVELDIHSVSRIHLAGGSIIGTSRENPTKNTEKIKNTFRIIKELGIGYLLTIGGDGTLSAASKIEELSNGSLKVVHVPKTIDNDLPLPERVCTFGFQTAREVGFNLVKNIMEDSKTTGRWYFVITMGRSAGHLALGISKAAGATLAIIGEEFKDEKIKLSAICDILEGSIIKRLAYGKPYGVAVLSEGLALKLDTTYLNEMENVERDQSGHVRLSEIDLGRLLKDEVKRRLTKKGLMVTIVDKNIGYELRCAAPIPFDIEYTRDLGYGAAKFLINEGTGAMVTLVGGKIKPLYFENLIDPETGFSETRLVNIYTESYEVARKYMIRLEKDDFLDPEKLEKLAKAANITTEEFVNKFGYLADEGV